MIIVIWCGLRKDGILFPKIAVTSIILEAARMEVAEL